jgi:hypothetical protein
MAAALRYVAWFTIVGAAVPIVVFALSLALPLFPGWLFGIVLLLCPAYALFVATAACEPFDACSLTTLGVVVGWNIGLYGVIGLIFWFTRERWQFARAALFGALLIASGWWAKIWVWGA